MAYENYATWREVPVERPVLSVVVPTYNEERRIVPTLGAIASHVSDLGMDWELIVADSGSTDDTVSVVRDLGFANLRVLTSQTRDGKGSGVRRGVLAARGEYVLFADADGSTPIEAIDEFLEIVRGSHDVVVASRTIGRATAGRSALRHVLSAGLRILMRTALRLGVEDSQCGFKLFTAESARRLFQAQTLTGFSFDMEILYLARKLGYRVAEIPVAWVDAPDSKVDAGAEVFRFVRDLVRIRINDLQGVYRYA